MIIFNHNIIFRNEPELRDEIQNDALETIFIIEVAGYPLPKTFPLKSAWLPTSGQEVQYRSCIPFEEADEKFSWTMEIKGVVNHRRDGRQFLYRPLVREDEVNRSMVGDLVERLFAGDALELVNHLVAEGDIDLAELEELRRKLAERRRKSGGGNG